MTRAVFQVQSEGTDVASVDHIKLYGTVYIQNIMKHK